MLSLAFLVFSLSQQALPLSEAAAPPRGLARLCETDPEYCAAPAGRAAGRLQADRDLFILLDRVNRETNRSLHYRSDRRQHGAADVWSRPGVGRAGDCEDYVLAKRERLMRAGVSPQALSVAAVHSPETGFHAVLVVRTTEGDYVLDSARSGVRRWDQTPYRWLSAQTSASLLDWRLVSERP